eukprot:3647184-Rhodomonas_salina.2
MCVGVHRSMAELVFRVPSPSVIPGHNCCCREAKAASLEQIPNCLFWKGLVLEDSSKDFPAIALSETEIRALCLREVA